MSYKCLCDYLWVFGVQVKIGALVEEVQPGVGLSFRLPSQGRPRPEVDLQEIVLRHSFRYSEVYSKLQKVKSLSLRV